MENVLNSRLPKLFVFFSYSTFVTGCYDLLMIYLPHFTHFPWKNKVIKLQLNLGLGHITSKVTSPIWSPLLSRILFSTVQRIGPLVPAIRSPPH